MSRPVCCGRNATPYTKRYANSWWPSWEQGFRCKVCGAIRIPFITAWDSSYMDAMDSVRAVGIAFDESLQRGLP